MNGDGRPDLVSHHRVHRTGLALVLPRAAEITGAVAFEGPAAAGRLDLYDDLSGALRDTLRFTEADDPFSFFLEPGQYRIEMNAPGYLPFTHVFSVGMDPFDLGGL